ncbi:MAG: YveK family protein [Anaerolineae bacterium]
MILKRYWNIIWRRAWLMILLLILVLGSYAITYRPQEPSFVATMRFTVGIIPEPSSGQYYTFDRYYTWLTAEYLIDDLSEVVKSNAFAQDVALASGVAVATGAIQGSTASGKLHRILSLSISWPNELELRQIATAAAQVLQDRNNRYLGQLGSENAVITLIDPPTINQTGTSLRQRIDLPLRLLLALVAGITLAFIIDYLDDTLRGKDDVECLGITVLAEIPRTKGLLYTMLHHRDTP